MSIENELRAAALALPRNRRAELAKALLESLDEEPEIDAAWRKAVRERLDAYRAGELSSSTAADVIERARSRRK